MRHLIRVSTVCQGPFHGTSELNDWTDVRWVMSVSSYLLNMIIICMMSYNRIFSCSSKSSCVRCRFLKRVMLFSNFLYFALHLTASNKK